MINRILLFFSQGDVGLKGATGLTGNAGADGSPGERGANGKTGDQGMRVSELEVRSNRIYLYNFLENMFWNTVKMDQILLKFRYFLSTSR